MDALPIQETTGLPYESVHRAARTAAGTTATSTMLLCAARYLAETRRFDGARPPHLPARRGRQGRRARDDRGRAVRAVPVRRGLRAAQLARASGRHHRDPAGADHGGRRPRRDHGARPGRARRAAAPGRRCGSLRRADRDCRAHPGRAPHRSQRDGGAVAHLHPGRHLAQRDALRGRDHRHRAQLRRGGPGPDRAGAARPGRGRGAGRRMHCDAGLRPLLPGDGERPQCAQHALRCRQGALRRIDAADAPAFTSEDFAFMLEKMPGAYIWLGQGSPLRTAQLHTPATTSTTRCFRSARDCSRPWPSAGSRRHKARSGCLYAVVARPGHRVGQSARRRREWACLDSNQGPRDYESPALTAVLQARRAILAGAAWAGTGS